MSWITEIFARPGFLWLLLIIPLLLGWYIWKYKIFRGEILYSGFQGIENSKRSYKEILRHFQHLLRLLAIAALIIALAGPQTSKSDKRMNVEGIDIMLAVDVSGSMLAEDLKPNRIEAAKEVASDFISKRPNDRIGLIAYSGIAFTQCPLSIDHVVLQTLLSRIKNNMVADGTAIGDGLGLAVERLRHSESVSKVIILLTDGINNMGFIDPTTAAQIAREFGIRIYTIGVGKKGKAPYPFRTPFGIQYDYVDVEIDEPLLKNIAEMSGGKYFRAVDNRTLQEIYDEIDMLERTKIEVAFYTHHTERFHIFILFAIGLFSLELFLKYRIVRMLP
jgi:Ca-activated chloride channel homolog